MEFRKVPEDYGNLLPCQCADTPRPSCAGSPRSVSARGATELGLCSCSLSTPVI